MAKQSAGLLMYRETLGTFEFLLGHPGGPFFRNKDRGAWSIPKGELQADEEPLESAQREFHEETGVRAQGPFEQLTSVKQKGGKLVHAWLCRGDCDPTELKSNTFPLEWPPRSGNIVEFPEIDAFDYFDSDSALEKINPAQAAFIKEALRRLSQTSENGSS